MENFPHKQELVQRENRYSSHALVDLRRFKHLPFGIRSAILLDISMSGFKLELTGDSTCKPGDQYWLTIPLAPLGIYAPSKLSCKGECRWFDAKRQRLGGVFMELSKMEHHVIEQVVEALHRQGQTLR